MKDRLVTALLTVHVADECAADKSILVHTQDMTGTPAKRNLHLTTAATRSKSGFEAVSLRCSPVMKERQRLLKPFSLFFTDDENVHASQLLSVYMPMSKFTTINIIIIAGQIDILRHYWMLKHP